MLPSYRHWLKLYWFILTEHYTHPDCHRCAPVELHGLCTYAWDITAKVGVNSNRSSHNTLWMGGTSVTNVYIVFYIVSYKGIFFNLLVLCVFVYLLNLVVPNQFSHSWCSHAFTRVWALSLWDAGCCGGVYMHSLVAAPQTAAGAVKRKGLHMSWNEWINSITRMVWQCLVLTYSTVYVVSAPCCGWYIVKVFSSVIFVGVCYFLACIYLTETVYFVYDTNPSPLLTFDLQSPPLAVLALPCPAIRSGLCVA